MNEPEVFENPCAICRVRSATQLCDYVVQYSNSIIFMRTWKQFQEVNAGGHNETCDLPMCKECSKKVGHNAELCPHHFKLHKQVTLPDELEKRRIQQKAKALNDSWREV